MIQMNITAAGLAAIARQAGLIFTQFKAGSGFNADGDSIQAVAQDIPISYSKTYIAGNTYVINGEPAAVSYNSVKVCGTLVTSQAPDAYDWTELALMAKEGIAGEEFAFAYGAVTSNAIHIDPEDSATYIIPFDIVFDTTPNITVNTTETGVGWNDFLDHANALVSSSSAHGLSVSGGDLLMNGASLDLARNDTLKAVSGLEAIVSALPAPSVDLLGKQVLSKTENALFRLEKTENIAEGNYVAESGSSWVLANYGDDGALLVVGNDVEPSEGEITLDQAQSHFLRWESSESLDERLLVLETPSEDGALSSASSDNLSYNSEWVSRMTGSGTAASPYVIYTPYDFNEIRNHPAAHYRLANNLDFGPAIGMTVALEGGSVVYSDIDDSAPLYNSGAGFETVSQAFTGSLDGNGKVIKGIIICGTSAKGIFSQLKGATITDLTLKDGFIIYTGTSAAQVGAFFGTMGTGQGSTLRNLVNYCTVASIQNVAAVIYAGGIFGDLYAGSNMDNIVMNCANHGSVSAFGSGAVVSGIGEIRQDASYGSTVMEGCYNTGSLDGNTVCGISCISTNSSRLTIRNCYNAGVLSGAANTWALFSTATSPSVSYCYGRSDQGTITQGAAADIDYMAGQGFVDDMNTGLSEASFTADDININGGFPIKTAERSRSEGIPGELPVALLDRANAKVYSSKLSYSRLASLVSRQEMRALLPSITFPSVTLASASWTQNNGVYEQSVAVTGATARSAGALIPRSADCFTYGIALSGFGSGIALFTASSQPVADITAGLVLVS